MRFYDEDIELGETLEEINPDNFPTEDNFQSFDLKDFQNAVYEGTKQALEDYDLQKKKEEADLLDQENLASPSPEPSPQKVIVENFPSSTSVDNFEDLDFHTMTDAISGDPVVEFASSTDSTMYTVSTSAPVSSATGQSAVYLLEIRNILLIFCLLWFVVYIISMLKKVAKRHGKGE